MRTMEVETEVPRDGHDVTATTANQTTGSVEAEGTLVTSPITNLSLTDYYTIAIMADMIDSPSSVVDSKFCFANFW